MTIYEEVESLRPGWRNVFLCPVLYWLVSSISESVEKERSNGVTVYPMRGEVFRAFRYVDPADVRVVILGQDPYSNPGQAMGLSFSVPLGVRLPPSLRNIFLELQREYGGDLRQGGDLRDWASQGVLLLNTILTVRDRSESHGGPLSHKDLGWQRLTDEAVEEVNRCSPGCVFMLWGRHAQTKGRFVDTHRHLVLESSHPSPLSFNRGFNGCDHFVEADRFHRSRGIRPVDWLF